jgi:hypothetical protein
MSRANPAGSATHVPSSIALSAMLVVLLATSPRAFGQWQLVDQTRTLTANATATNSRGSAGTQSNNTDSFTAAGVYNNTLNASKLDTIPLPDIPSLNETFTITSTAQQNSNVTSALLSATGSASASAKESSASQYIFIEAFGESLYDVDFTVNAPTPFTIAGNITGDDWYHPGPQEVVTASVTLSSSASGTPLYTVSHTLNFVPNQTVATFDDPVSFSTVLLPGQTYTLKADASADSIRASVGYANTGNDNAAFSFAAAVPEPTALMTFAAALTVSLMTTRRRLGDRPGTSRLPRTTGSSPIP